MARVDHPQQRTALGRSCIAERADGAHSAQPATAAVTASVSGVTSVIGNSIPARAGDPAGRFPEAVPLGHGGAVRVTGVSSPNFPAAPNNEPGAAGLFSGASPLAIAGAVLFDLWPAWSVVALGILLAVQS